MFEPSRVKRPAPQRDPGMSRSRPGPAPTVGTSLLPGPGTSPAALLALQRAAGNAAATALLSRAGPAPVRRPAPPAAAPLMGAAVAGPVEAERRLAEEPPTQEETAADRSPSVLAAVTAAGPEPPPDQLRVQRGLLDDIAGGVASLAGGLRDRVLGTIVGYARRLPGYELLCVALGRDPVAGTPVTRSAAAVIRGVLALIPRGDELRQQLEESGAIQRAGAWFDEQIPQLGLTWEAISGLFRRAWDSLSAGDLLDPAGAWQRIAGIFGPTLARLRDFAVVGGRKIMEFVFEGAMAMAGGLGQQVMGIIRRAGDVFNQILRDPIAFGRNLIEAVRGGLGQFLSNIGTHLRNGLIGWLTGAIRGAIRIPAEFNLRGILGMAMEFLGLTWANVRTRIVTVIGERAMGLLERGVDVVRDVAQNGISALTGRISQFVSGLVETVIGGIREWVTNSVVGAAITRLISMFNPAGAVIQAIIAIYNTVKFFIERAQQLGALANSIFDSIAAIASGGVGSAKNAVEQALGRAVPVVLGFLSRLIGLGDVATPVRNVMTRVQGVISSAIDRVVGWIAGMARRVGGAMRGGGQSATTPAAAPVGAAPAGEAPMTVGGQNHRLYLLNGTPTVASDPQPIRALVSAIAARLRQRDPETQAQGAALQQQINELYPRLLAPERGARREQILALISSLLKDLVLLVPRLQNRSVSVCYYEIMGERGDMAALSGERSMGPPSTVPRFFQTLAFSDVERRDPQRHHDSEIKLLEAITARFGTRAAAPVLADSAINAQRFPSVTGIVHLNSDFVFCPSCAWIVGQFRRSFPNVNLVAETNARPLRGAVN